MADDKKKRDPFGIFNTKGATVRQPLAQDAGLDPTTFSEEAPVARPDVPAIEEQLPEGTTDNSFLGGFLNIMDNIVPDDMGGLIRGESEQWLPDIPYVSDLYRNTVGNVLGVPLTAAEGVVDAINWGSEQMNHLGAAAFSALPGGIQTLDWEQSQDISLGQVVTANAAINNNSGFGWLINVATLQTPLAGLTAIGEAQDPNNILYQEGFDILDPEQRKEAFESGGMGQFSSGFADAIWLVAADPTIIGGKLTNVIRLGTKIGEFGGLTNQALRTSNQVNKFANELVEQGDLIANLGIDGARASGRLTTQGEYLISAMDNNADQLINHPWVKSSPNKRDTRALLGSTSVEDPQTAAALAGALAGSAESWNLLRNLNTVVYDSAAQSLGVDVFAPVGTNIDDFATAGVKLTDDQVALGDQMVYEILGSRQELLAAGQNITRSGSRIGPKSVRAANAWRAGATRSQFENNAFKKSSSVNDGKKGHFIYETIEDIAGSRPLEVVRWVGRGTPNGIVFLKDGADGSSSLDEVSAWLRKSPIEQARAAEYLNEFATARQVTERMDILRRMEAEATTAIARSKGLDDKTAMKMYDGYNKRRAAALEQARKSETNFYVDPDTGKMVKVPDFYAELDQAYPMVDLKVFGRVVGNNKWLRYGEDVELGADYVNSLWKISVLMRFGYTMRNITEGSLRSLAVLGLVAANPRAWFDLPQNAIYYAKARRAIKGVKAEEQRLLGTRNDLLNARKVLDEAYEVSGYAKMKQYDTAAKEADKQIKAMQKAAKVKPLTKEEVKTLNKLVKVRDRNLNLKKEIEFNRYDPMIPEITDAAVQYDRIAAEVDTISNRLLGLTEVARSKMGMRRRGGYSKNNIDGYEVDGAYTGQQGSIALAASSADRTTYMTFDASVGRRVDQLSNSADFKKLDPKKLTAEQLDQYFIEYALRINNRYRNDAVGRMVLENRPVEDIKAFLMSPKGANYRKQLSISGRRLNTEDQVDEYLETVIRRLDNEMPADTRLRELALDHELTPAEVSAAMGSKPLPVITGRLVDDVDRGILGATKYKVDSITGAIMKGLGTIPENKLLRHPFYRSVFDAEQLRMWRLSQGQGVNVMDPAVQQQIATTAHRAALKATRETMYTIDRLSNAASLLRFVSPFFPAWENSMRTWGRIAWNNPAVLGYGNLLWNIPNNLGWVVDEFGNKVEKSNMLKDEGQYIIWPSAVQEFLQKDLGPLEFILPGEGLMTRQQGLNVVLPGADWWFSGVGPAATIPTAWFLRGKPEDAEVLRNAVGDEMFQQLVPSGNPNVDLWDALLPTTARRLKLMFNGETSDGAYITTWNQILEDKYIEVQLEGRAFTQADYEDAKKRIDRFWTWQIGAGAGAPFQSKIMSRYQVQRDAWARLIDDESIPYAQKIKLFTEQYPGFEAITRSGSITETGLNPNLKTWERITKNPDIVDSLYAIDPELVGMFGNMGRFDDPFSPAVYGEYAAMELGPNGIPVRRKLKPEEIVRNNQIRDGWTEYWQARDVVEERAIELGYSSLQVKEAEDLRNILDEAAAKLEARYPAWGEERKLYMDKLPAFIQGARIIVSKPELVGEDSTVAALSEYLQIRDYIASELKLTSDDDAREQLRQIGYEAAFKLRQKDIGFADLYDQYLDRDDFREI